MYGLLKSLYDNVYPELACEALALAGKAEKAVGNQHPVADAILLTPVAD